MNSITVQELVAWRNDGVEHMLLDIREPYERDVSHIGGVHILMEDIEGLEEIIGDELTFDDLDSVMRQNPMVLIMILRRIIEFI